MAKWEDQKTNQLFRAILALKNLEEARRFLRDLLTEEEIIEFAKRWQAAQMLNRGVSYSTIEKKTGLSSTTVARVSKWLRKGMGGYRLMLRRLGSHHRNSSTS